MRTLWLGCTLALAGILALMERFALVSYMYWHHPWFDTIMHFTGGVTIGTFAIALLQGQWQPKRYVVLVLIGTVGWELFEYSIGASHGPSLFLDTASDLLFDAIGVIIPYCVARFTIWHSK